MDNLPIQIEQIEGLWVVAERFPTKEILDEDVPPGSVIMHIEGKSVPDFLRERLQIDISKMSIQAIQGKLNWDRPYLRDQRFSLNVRYPDGSTHQRVLRANRRTVSWTAERRKAYMSAGHQPNSSFSEVIQNDILYIRYSDCDQTNTDRLLHLLSTKTDRPPRAVIVDLRGNRGGSTPVEVVRHLISAPVSSFSMKTRCSISYLDAYFQALGLLAKSPQECQQLQKETVGKFISYGLLPSGYTPGWVVLQNKEIIIPVKDSYRGLVVLLTNWETGSAAEDMVLLLRQGKNVTIIGTPTFGSTGQPYLIPLPGGGEFRVCSARSVSSAGTDMLPAAGVSPDIHVHPTVSAIIARQDVWLKAAIAYITTQTRANPSSASSPLEP